MSTHDLVVTATIIGFGGFVALLLLRLSRLWIEPALSDAGLRLVKRILLGLFGVVVVASLVIMLRMIDVLSHENTQQATELQTLRRQLRQACGEGELKTSLVESGLRYQGDVASIDDAHQLLFYGEPWLRLCGAAPSADALLVDDRVQLLGIINDIKQQL